MSSQRNLLVSLSGFATVITGVLTLCVAAVGIYQLRSMARSTLAPLPSDYPVAGVVWNFYDGGAGPAEKPAKRAAKVQQTFVVCGLIGIILVVAGATRFLIGRKHNRNQQ